MSRRPSLFMWGGLIAVIAAGAAVARRDESAGPCLVPDLRARLLALRPDDPMPYFELAEELAAESKDSRGRSLARTLFVIAYETDRRSPRPIGLAPSVCLALATIAEDENERRWLLAIAGADAPTNPTLARDEDSPGFLLAQAIGHARAGEARGARSLLAQPGVQDMLDSSASPAARARFIIEEAVAQQPCHGCRGRRTVRSTLPREQGGSEELHSLCPVCRGNPGPALTREEFVATLAAESELLNATHAQWGAQAALDGGAPLREPDPGELLMLYTVDPDAPWWQPAPGAIDPLEGRWTAEPPPG